MPPSAWLGPLYEQFREELYLTAWTRLRRREPAEDAVHAAIVRLAELQVPPRDPKLYLFRAVRNAAIDLSRQRSRRRESPLDRIELPAHDDAEALDRSETLETARAALAALDERSRETVELHLYAGLTFREIGELLGEPLPTVASRYRRAISSLSEILEAKHE